MTPKELISKLEEIIAMGGGDASIVFQIYGHLETYPVKNINYNEHDQTITLSDQE